MIAHHTNVEVVVVVVVEEAQKLLSVGKILMLPLCGILLPMRLMRLHCYLLNMKSLSSRAQFCRGGFHSRG